MSGVENRLVISGVVDSKPQTRNSPAGIPISRFVLRHRSEQSEAGMRRQIQCTIGVVAAGAGLQEAIKQLHQGSEVSVWPVSSAGPTAGQANIDWYCMPRPSN